jgi:hypothetical protein
MKSFNINAIALAIGLAVSAGAIAEGVSKDEYKVSKDSIAAKYTSAKTHCGSLSANTKDICMASAEGDDKVSMAELNAHYDPSANNLYQVRVAKADADYGVAKERCDDLAGNKQDVCVKQAKEVETTAKADAESWLKTSTAQAKATEVSTEAQTEADQKSAKAQEGAATEKLDAKYEVAKEKCDAFAGNTKTNCLNQAKASFGAE